MGVTSKKVLGIGRSMLPVLAVGLGLFVPWNRVFPGAAHLSTWLEIAAAISSAGWMSFTAATILLLVIGIALAFFAAGMMTWVTAWRGSHKRGTGVGGSYRFVRYAAVWATVAHVLALALLMSPAGAGFTLVATGVTETMWVLLNKRLGNPGNQMVDPSDVPARRAEWGWAVVSEAYFWAVAACFAVAGWRYNAFLLQRCVLVCFGAGLVLRALFPAERPARA